MELIHSFPEFQTKLIDDSLLVSVLNPSLSWRLETMSLRVFRMLKLYSGSQVIIDLQAVQCVDDVVLEVLRTIHQLALHDSREVTCLVEAEKNTDTLTEYSESHSLPLLEPTLEQSSSEIVDLNEKVHFQLT